MENISDCSMPKFCRKCKQRKSYSDFYKHKEMYDGYLNICKDCTKKRVQKHREKNIDSIRAYDRERGKTKARKLLSAKNTKKRRHEVKGRTASQSAVAWALKNGKIEKPDICSYCKNGHPQIEAHHEDYSKKLDVIWLCSICHSQLHSGKISI